jgi:predicted O-methyltransferase YrrM
MKSIFENNQSMFKGGNLNPAAPQEHKDIKKIFIQDKLQEMGISMSQICLGDFDYIGEFTAKKSRARTSENYHKAGAFFRPNYERGILIYHLIKRYNLESMLEIGYGRGYGTFCAAKAFSELGKGKITTVDPNLDEQQINALTQVFPEDWFERVSFVKSTSDQFFANNLEPHDLIYIDGDHTYEAVKKDWENSKDRYNRFVLFDDYDASGKKIQDIEVTGVVNAIDDPSKELIIMDRRIFQDDRNIADEDMKYGQVLISKIPA